MKVAFLPGANQDFIFKEWELPIPKENEVRIKIHFAALNHRDLWTQKGQYRGSSENLVLGSDGSGTIDSFGIQEAESNLKISREGNPNGSSIPTFNIDVLPNFKIGDEVIINPSFDWGKDKKAQSNYFKILGNPDQGTFSSFLNVPLENVFPKPPHLSLEEAAALPLAGLTAYRALFTRGQLQKTNRVLITGIGGGAAQMAMQMAIAFGTEVYVSSGDPEKIRQALQQGAKDGFLYTSLDWVKLAKEIIGEGFDLIIDSAAGKGFSDLIDLTKPGGNLVFFGGTAGAIGPIIPAKVFWKQINILGTTMGTAEEFKALLGFYQQYQLKPVIDRIYPYDEINEAFKRMESGKQLGKIVLKIS